MYIPYQVVVLTSSFSAIRNVLAKLHTNNQWQMLSVPKSFFLSLATSRQNISLVLGVGNGVHCPEHLPGSPGKVLGTGHGIRRQEIPTRCLAKRVQHPLVVRRSFLGYVDA